MKVYNVNIRDLMKILIEIYEEGYDYIDIERIDEDRVRLIPKSTKLLENRKKREISPDTNLENLI